MSQVSDRFFLDARFVQKAPRELWRTSLAARFQLADGSPVHFQRVCIGMSPNGNIRVMILGFKPPTDPLLGYVEFERVALLQENESLGASELQLLQFFSGGPVQVYEPDGEPFPFEAYEIQSD